MWDLVQCRLEDTGLGPWCLVEILSGSQLRGSVWLRLAAIVVGLYPPGRERLWEVTIVSLVVGAVVAVGAGAEWYPPGEVRLERVWLVGWLADCVISI